MSAAASTVLPAGPTRPGPGARGETVRDRGAVRRDSLTAARWEASGTTKILGDVRVDEARAAGLLSVGGRLMANRLTLDGTLEVGGPTDVSDTLVLEGAFRSSGPIHLGSGRIRGVVRGSAELTADRDLVVVGSLEVPTVRAGLLDLDGSARVPGQVRVRSRFHARLRADSVLGEVSAPEVALRGPSPGLVPTIVRKVFGGGAVIGVDRIEADRVELEAVDVALVRSPAIVLGPAAHVTVVEGTIVRRHSTARVGPESRSSPPHGLTR